MIQPSQPVPPPAGTGPTIATSLMTSTEKETVKPAREPRRPQLPIKTDRSTRPETGAAVTPGLNRSDGNAQSP